MWKEIKVLGFSFFTYPFTSSVPSTIIGSCSFTVSWRGFCSSNENWLVFSWRFLAFCLCLQKIANNSTNDNKMTRTIMSQIHHEIWFWFDASWTVLFPAFTWKEKKKKNSAKQSIFMISRSKFFKSSKRILIISCLFTVVCILVRMKILKKPSIVQKKMIPLMKAFGLFNKKNQNGCLKNGNFPAPPILNIFSWNFYGLVLGLVEFIDAKGIGVAQLTWLWGCPT